MRWWQCCGCTSLVGVANVYRRSLDAPAIRFADIFARVALHRLNSLLGALRSTGLRIGFASAFSGMTVMRM